MHLLLFSVILPIFFAQICHLSAQNVEQQKMAKKMKVSRRNGIIGQQTFPFFDPKTYTSKEFLKFVEDFGAQIRSDLEKAHEMTTKHSEGFLDIRKRILKLEKVIGRDNCWVFIARGSCVRHSIIASSILSIVLLVGCLLLVLALANLGLWLSKVGTNLWSRRHCLRQQKQYSRPTTKQCEADADVERQCQLF